MNVLLQRIAVIVGLIAALLTAVWWLGSTRLVLDRGTDPARAAADALHALLLVRAMALAVLTLRTAALRGARSAMSMGVGLIAPSWPVVLLAWSASTVAFSNVLAAEALLVAECVAVALIGAALRRLFSNAELALVAGSALGILIAAAIWAAPGLQAVLLT